MSFPLSTYEINIPYNGVEPKIFKEAFLMFIGFIYFLVVTIITTFFGGLIESKMEKDENQTKIKKEKQINKIKNVNRKWFNIDVK